MLIGTVAVEEGQAVTKSQKGGGEGGTGTCKVAE